MKKRLISFLLALCMALSLVPVGAVADGTSTFASGKTITATELGLRNNVPTNPGSEADGWTYDSTSKTLTIYSGSTLDLGDAMLNLCDTAYNVPRLQLVNYGVVKSGTFKLYYYERFINKGTIAGGKFIAGANHGYLYNSNGSCITGGFFGKDVQARAESDSGYTISGGVFLEEPTGFSGTYTYVYVDKSYSLDKVNDYEKPVGDGDDYHYSFYMFGEDQTVTLTIPYEYPSYTIVDEWRYAIDDSNTYTNSKGDKNCPVYVNSPNTNKDNTSNPAHSYRKVTITSKPQTESHRVFLWAYAYKTALKISDGYPNTDGVYSQDNNHYYALNPSHTIDEQVEPSPSTHAKWEYDKTAKTLKLHTKTYFDLTGLSKDVQVETTYDDVDISATDTVDSPITVSSSTVFRSGTFTNVTVSGNGAIDKTSKATLTNVTLSGTSATINGGVFKGTVTLAEGAGINQITGGLFENDITDASGSGQLYRVTIKGNKAFKVGGYTDQSFTEVYVSPSTELTVTSTDDNAEDFGRINSTKLDANPSYCTVNGKTITFTVQDLINAGVVTDADNKTIVLASALESPTPDLFTVSGTPTDLVYGDSTISEKLNSITAVKNEGVDVGDPKVAGFYKLDDNGKVPANPELLEAAKVTEAGDYVVVLKVEKPTDTYDSAPTLYDTTNKDWTFTIAKKAITADDFTFTPPTDLTYDGNAKEAEITVKGNAAAISNVRYAVEGSSDYTATPKAAGTYRVTATVMPDANHTFDLAELPTNWTFTILKKKLTAADFEKSDTYQTIVPRSVVLGSQDYTVEFREVTAIQSLPVNAGTYQAYVTVHALNYEADGELTDSSWRFTVDKKTPTKGLLNVIGRFNPVYTGSAITVTVRAKTAEELEGSHIDAPAGPLTGPLTVKYYQLDENKNHVYVDPILPGTYYFEVVTSGEGNYKAATLTNFSWWFTITEPENPVHVEGGYAYYLDGEVERTITEDTKVLAGTKVYLKMASAETPKDPGTPDVTLLAAEEDSEVGTVLWFVDPKTKVELTIENPDSPTAWFIMPRGEVWVTTTKPSDDTPADNISSGSDAGVGVALVVGGAALGGAAYLVGTQLWLEANLPAEAAIPTSRQQLAALLWDAAGKPEPASTALFTDISAAAADQQKAARWCVEQGLMQAEGDTFQPAKHVFRPQVIKAWKQLQAGQKAG